MAEQWAGSRSKRELEWLRAKCRHTDEVCCICREPIDYSLRGKPMALSVQHLKPRSLYPHLTFDRTNYAPAHLICNQQVGTSGEKFDLGKPAW